jgi:sugar phosphate isomerase/epimerase
MKRLSIGIRLESLGLPLRQGLTEAGRLGVAGVQVDAAGDLAPKNLSQTGRREFRNLLRSYNLELTALGCPLRHGLDHADNLQRRIEHVKDALTLSYDLGPRRVVIEAGQVPDDKDIERARVMTEALAELGRHGDRTGTVLALETGLESGEVLARFLDRFDTGGLGVNLDPGNLLVHGFAPCEAMRALNRRIVHVHAKDARRGSPSRAAQEVPLGAGDIDWLEFLAVLEEIDYHGWLTVERESGDKRADVVASGVAFLRRLVG